VKFRTYFQGASWSSIGFPSGSSIRIGRLSIGHQPMDAACAPCVAWQKSLREQLIAGLYATTPV